MTSLQNHLRQLSGNKQNKKVAFKEGDFFYSYFWFFRRSRISMRSFSSLLGSGSLGASACFSSSFFLEILFTTLMSMKIQKATMRKSKQVWRKLP